MPGIFQLSVDEAVQEAAAAQAARHRRASCSSACPSTRTPSARNRRIRRRAGPDRRARDQARRARPAGADRRVPVRVHLARALRHPGRRARGQRPDRGAAGRDGRVARGSRRRLRGAVRHDGRARRRDPRRRSTSRGFDAHRHHVVFGEVLLGLLRTVPRGGRLHAAVRRPAHAPDGSRPTWKRRCASCRSTSKPAPTW